ncbi:MAG: HyaD/HybD family hydrogenase maturation endopeptidase [Deltaproteobacteria bacterium]|jgi:hydrogenase maturation protease|nr:HyaD/HybD family hydrogenase maturation endopeptidase [Deltaproteobacteria bacterium]
MSDPEILVLGVGNILLGDEGIGVHTVRRLREEYVFPPNVRLLDGGTLGLSLMEHIESCSWLLVLDAVRGGGSPGSVYRLEGEGLRSSLGLSDSMHQVDLADTLILCELSGGRRPRAVVLGLEPESVSDFSPDLSATAKAAQPKLCLALVAELEKLGCKVRKKD